MKRKKTEEPRREELFDAWFNNQGMTCFTFAPYEVRQELWRRWHEDGKEAEKDE